MVRTQFQRAAMIFGVLCLTAVQALACLQDGELNTPRDSDQDGLSDFSEQHKYLTDPEDDDTDGDGIADGEWLERREHQYYVRSVVQVMKPVTIEYLNDDYQDVRVLDETESYVELEVIHYPFNTVGSTIVGDDNWRESVKAKGLQRWLKPGPTSDWTPELQKEIRQSLSKDGIDIDSLNDMQVVEQVSKWLLKRAEYHDGFSSFVTAFDEDGKPFIPEELRGDVGTDSELTPEQQWAREISASGMFRNRARGSCSSSAIYLNGCLRAVGIPTRTILCIPIVDANDQSELTMVRRLEQPTVRRDIVGGITRLKGSWASHTFNEVYVGGRWRRLNYARLGQNIYDPGLFGLMTHVATFHDWADARMPETIGRRQAAGTKSDIFGGPNPYSTLSLRDQMGRHCKLDLPQAGIATLNVDKIQWTDASDLHKDIRANCQRTGRFGLIATVSGFTDRGTARTFIEQADLRVYMDVAKSVKGANPVRLGVGFDKGCYWLSDRILQIYVPFGGGDRRDLVPGVSYRFRPRNDNKEYQWAVPKGLTIVRSGESTN